MGEIARYLEEEGYLDLAYRRTFATIDQLSIFWPYLHYVCTVRLFWGNVDLGIFRLARPYHFIFQKYHGPKQLSNSI